MNLDSNNITSNGQSFDIQDDHVYLGGDQDPIAKYAHDMDNNRIVVSHMNDDVISIIHDAESMSIESLQNNIAKLLSV